MLTIFGGGVKSTQSRRLKWLKCLINFGRPGGPHNLHILNIDNFADLANPPKHFKHFEQSKHFKNQMFRKFEMLRRPGGPNTENNSFSFEHI